MPDHGPDNLRFRRARLLPWRGPASLRQSFQDGSVDGSHDAGGFDGRARLPRHDRIGFFEMIARALCHLEAGFGEGRMRQNRADVVAHDASIAECLARQIETADAGILVEIAQDVG